MNKIERVIKLTSEESQNYWRNITKYDMQIPKVKNNPTFEFCRWYEMVINRINNYGSDWEKQMNVESGCHSGCSACCSMLIEIFKLEAFVIIEYIKKTNQEYLFDRIENTYNIVKDLITESPLGTDNKDEIEKFKVDYFKKKIPCVFLVDGRCSIYPVRPVNCATYHSYGLYKECLKDDEINNPKSDAYNIDWPLEPWSARQFGNFFAINSKKYHIKDVHQCGVLPLLIKECLDTNYEISKK